ncbi:hypothetical protein C8N31_104366 [Sulfitobacter mediterraneus]|uniref:Uncharacterized protein n=1 Tax=Sulfitobacter mediterraneus TaxID=83219 RepID=A0A2T6CG51_9RHOB|nr:hypothetical protein C8N31_104366 [Sulfitobacter mediterraneus]
MCRPFSFSSPRHEFKRHEFKRQAGQRQTAGWRSNKRSCHFMVHSVAPIREKCPSSQSASPVGGLALPGGYAFAPGMIAISLVAKTSHSAPFHQSVRGIYAHVIISRDQ